MLFSILDENELLCTYILYIIMCLNLILIVITLHQQNLKVKINM